MWNCVVTGHSDSGHLWKFGPHPWNTDLAIGYLDVNFIAKLRVVKQDNPTGVYY